MFVAPEDAPLRASSAVGRKTEAKRPKYKLRHRKEKTCKNRINRLKWNLQE